MTRTVRILSFTLPIVFVAFIALIIVSFRGNERRDRVSGEVTSALRTGDRPQRVGDRFEGVQTIGGRTVLRIRADRTTGFESGWYTLEGVHVTVYRAGGRTYEITSAEAQVRGETKELEAKGNVRLESNDGMQLRTSILRFDGRQLRGDEPLEFRLRSWSGRAGSLLLDVASETVRLLGGVEGATPATAELPASDFRADEAEFVRRLGEMRLIGSVAINRGRDRFSADRAIARSDLENDRLRGLAGVGSASITMPQGAGADASGPLEVRADRFDGEFDGEGRLTAVQAMGSPAVADLAGPPQRTVTAPSFRLHMPMGVLREIQATGGVRVVERDGGVSRVVVAQIVSAAVDPDTRGVTSVQATGSVRFSDGGISGEGDRANWNLALGRVILTSEAPRLPTVRRDGDVLRGRRIDVDLASGTLTAHEQVYASIASTPGPSRGTAVFDGSAPVLVNANEAVLAQSHGSAVFRGNVRAWQGDDTLFAEELRVSEQQGALSATGRVRTRLRPREQRGSEPAVLRTTSDSLNARRAENRIDLEGNVEVVETGRVVSADRVVVLLNESGGGVKRLEGSGNLRVREAASGRQGSGSSAVYDPQKSTIVLEGEPARISDAQGEIRGRQILFNVTTNKVEVLSGADPTQATYNPPSR